MFEVETSTHIDQYSILSKAELIMGQDGNGLSFQKVGPIFSSSTIELLSHNIHLIFTSLGVHDNSTLCIIKI